MWTAKKKKKRNNRVLFESTYYKSTDTNSCINTKDLENEVKEITQYTQVVTFL